MSLIEIGSIKIGITDLLDIALVGYVFYRLIHLVKGTRAVSVIYGLIFLVIVFYLSDEFGLYTLNWLLANFLGSFFIVAIILFQKDIRRALAQMGTQRFWKSRSSVSDKMLNEIILAVLELAKSRTGALIVFEKNILLGDIQERGVSLDAQWSKDLLLSLFIPTSPLHDGAVIIRGDRILSAGCILPLSVGTKHRADLGTRHRAAIGVTEDTDAVALVVSEERGEISVALGGRLTSSLDEVRLKRVLSKVWGS